MRRTSVGTAKNKNERPACEFCDGVTEPRVMRIAFPYRGETVYIEDVPLWACNKCAEEYFDAPVYKQLEAIAKRRGTIREKISFPLARYNAKASVSRKV
jgi:YgiT-type zinc finger domain-containing protein